METPGLTLKHAETRALYAGTLLKISDEKKHSLHAGNDINFCAFVFSFCFML